MTSAAFNLQYELGLPSYGDLKLKSGKLHKEDRLAIFKPEQVFWMRRRSRMVPFSATTDDE